MTIQLIDTRWDEEFNQAIQDDASELRIVCPFIKARALEKLLSHNPDNIQVITRFNLADFAGGVSDIMALRKLLDAKARIRGVLNLHAKLYIFGKSRAIITSCNLTEAALRRNHEFGMVIVDEAVIAECLAYFDSLWQLSGSDLLGEQLDAWNNIITDYWLCGGRPNKVSDLQDFGVNTGVIDPPLAKVPLVVADASQAFVKLLGMSNNRAPLSVTTIEEVKGGGSHWAACYPGKKRPTGVDDNSVIFMGRLTEDPNDIRVFGRAIGMAYREGRDDATPADFELRPWKSKWSRYIRVHHAEFVGGTLKNGVSLNEMMDTLKSDSFASTQRNAVLGKGNINPRFAYRQQAAIKLSAIGLSWLSERLEEAFEAHGKIPQDSLDALDWPDSSTLPSLSH